MRIAVIEVDHNPRYPYKPPIPLTVVVNPVIEPLDDEMVEINEGCLSVPNLRGNVLRHVNVRVRYLDRDGNEHDEVKRGLTAGTFQHELDHLDGVLFLDRVPTRDAHDVGAVRALPSRRVRRAHHGVRRARAAREPRLWCELAWLGGERRRGDVLIEVDGDRHRRGDAAGPRRRRRAARGLTLPGLANAHSHAFHRALRGRTHGGLGARSGRGASRCTRWPPRSIPTRTTRWPAPSSPRWRWPGSRASASSTTSTTRPTAPPTTTRTRWARAWRRRGRRPASGSRCSTPATSTAGSRPRPDASAASATATPAPGPSGVDASTPTSGARRRRRDPLGPRRRPGGDGVGRRLGAPAGVPLHAHVSEQPAENEACLAAYGRTPTAVLADAGVLGASPRSTPPT